MTLGPFNSADDLYFPNVPPSEDAGLRLDDHISDPIGAPLVKTSRKSPKKPIKKPLWPWVAMGVVIGALGISVILRKEIAAAYVTSWLKSEGVNAKLKISKLGLEHAEGNLWVGTKTSTDLDIKSYALDYRLTPFAPKAAGFFHLKTVRLTGLDAGLSLKGVTPHFGSMDALVQMMLKAPASGAPLESIVLEDATLRLMTDYGLVRAKGGLSLKNGRLNFLSATLAPAHLNGPMGEGALINGHVRAEALAGLQGLKIEGEIEGDDLNLYHQGISAAEDVDGHSQNTTAQGVVATFDAILPYAISKQPQSGFDALNGAFAGHLSMRISAVQSEMADIEGLEAHASLKGHLRGRSTTLRYDGPTTLLARTETLKSGDLDTKGLRLEGPSLNLGGEIGPSGVTYQVTGPLSGHVTALRQGDIFLENADLALSDFKLDQAQSGLSSDFEGVAYAPRAGMGELSFDTLNLDLKGTVRPEDSDTVADITLGAQSDAAHFTGLKAMAEGRDVPVPRDSEHPKDAIITLDRELNRFGLRARGLKLNLRSHPRLRPPSITVGLRDDITATFADGGVMRLTALDDKILIDGNRGGHIVAELSGGDLPQATIEIAQLRFTDPNRYDLVSGQFIVQGTADLKPAQNIGLVASGKFATDTELNLNIDLNGPAHITAAQVMIGDRLEQVSLDLYQTGAHLMRLTPQGFFLNGHFANAALNAPNEQVAISGAEGAISIFPKGPSKQNALKITLQTATLSDTVAEDIKRFYPLMIAGTLNQDPLSAKGAFALSSTKYRLADGTGFKVAEVTLDHDMLRGAGTLRVATGDLNFAKGALQPNQLTPQVEAIMGSDTTGTASFEGGFSWAKDVTASAGTLRIADVNFKAATHVVKGMNGEIVFDSLAPLHSKDSQSIKVASILAGMPLTDLSTHLSFDNDHINIESLSVQTEGGEARLAPMKVMMDAKAAQTGTIEFDHLNLGKVIQGTDLSKSMTFEGTVTGRLPFSIQGQKFMVFDGVIDADGAGRISIPRGGVTNMDGGTATAQATDGTKPLDRVADQQVGISDFAYQAMEHLAFDSLQGKINSLPNGVLDINFHIKGYFDPPQKQQTKVSLFDFISGKWVDKPIKLQSGAKIDLYLNVPLNLDTLLQDLDQLNRHSAVK